MPKPGVTYHLCPHCARAVPASSGEQFCTNDGIKLLTFCPSCAQAISSPYAHFCSRCGQTLAGPLVTNLPGTRR